MKNYTTIKRVFIAIIILGAIAVGVILALSNTMPKRSLLDDLFTNNTTEENAATPKPDVTGKMVVEVIDSDTQKPIQDAEVIIPEIKQTFITDEKGQTAEISLPVIKNAHYESILLQSWGEATLIVKKPGYITYVLLYARVEPNRLREGPKILLFKESASSSSAPFTIIESPDKAWVNKLVEQVEKADYEKSGG